MIILRITHDFESENFSPYIDELKQTLHVNGPYTTILLSAEPPAIFKLIGDAASWVNVLKVPAGAFLAKLATNAADHVWKNRAKLMESIGTAALRPLRAVASAVTHARETTPRCKPAIGLALQGDDYWATILEIETTDMVEAAWIIANFVLKAEAAERVISQLLEDGFKPFGIFTLVLDAKGTWTIRWQDDNGNGHERTIE